MKYLQLGWAFIALFLSTPALFAQMAQGVVKDLTQGTPIKGAHILVKNTNEGTVSDSNGYFIMRLHPNEDSLQISYPGYHNETVPVTSDTIWIALEVIASWDTVATFDPESYEETYQIITGSNRTISSAPSRSYRFSHHLNPNIRYDNSSPEYNTVDYSPIKENNDKQVMEHPLSTFSIDVDRASYTIVRRHLEKGQLPPKDAVKIEELINYFSYDYPAPAPKGPPFSMYTELSDCPWNKNRKLLHIGLQAKKAITEKLPPNNLVFLMDVSGSMRAENKLPLAKKAMRKLVEQLNENDRVAIVVYAGAAGLVLPSTSGHNKERILQAIDNMQSGGSTAGGAGIKLAYQIAQENFIKGGNNRIILTTDGDFNVGASSDAFLEKLISEKRKTGIYISVLGFGMNNLKDNKLEIIADKGNGNYAFIDKEDEADRIFGEELTGTLYTIAKDVKLQLEFNPAVVNSYRLVGYENRLLNREDFENDEKDAGEMGIGHSVTALYELEMHPADIEASRLRYQQEKWSKKALEADEVGYLEIRYKLPEDSTSQLIELPIRNKVRKLKRSSDTFRFSAAIAAFGMKLRSSDYNKEMDYGQIIQLAEEAKSKDQYYYREGLISLIHAATKAVE